MNRLPAKSKGPTRVTVLSNQSREKQSEPASASTATSTRPSSQIRLLRFKAVQERTGLSRSTIWRLEQRGAFPRHRRISTNAVAWVEDEVVSWICSKIRDIAV